MPHLLSADARLALRPGVAAHPWIECASSLPPARRTQIAAIASCQLFFQPRPAALALPIRHPLLAQPVVEHVLSLDSDDLCFGTSDRALARTAFATRLPRSILERRVKGEASAHYARAVQADRAGLSEMILEGPLMAAGLLDRPAVERALDPHSLVFGGAFRAFSLYASLSAWATHWRAAA